MDIYTTFNHIYPLEWWKSEYKNHLRDHIGPLSILGATTALVTIVWGKYLALGFVCVAIITYPFSHRQIVYLMFLDAHETVYATAVISIQVFRMKFPLLDQWTLPMSVALAYAITVRGMRLRQLMQKQTSQIGELQNLSRQLTAQVDSMTRHASTLKESLTTLKKTIRKRDDVVERQNTAAETRNETVIAVEADYERINAYLKELTELCQVALEESGLLKQLSVIDTNNQTLAEQAEMIELKNKVLNALIVSLHEGNSKFHDLIARAQQGEINLQQELSSLREWFTQVSLQRTQSLI